MKTTILGILTILSALFVPAIQFLKTGTCDFSVAFTGVVAGIGLIKASDSAKVAP